MSSPPSVKRSRSKVALTFLSKFTEGPSIHPQRREEIYTHREEEKKSFTEQLRGVEVAIETNDSDKLSSNCASLEDIRAALLQPFCLDLLALPYTPFHRSR